MSNFDISVDKKQINSLLPIYRVTDVWNVCELTSRTVTKCKIKTNACVSPLFQLLSLKMARKRKIPVRKHHGVRDPLKQLEDREKRLKNVINNPPQKDDQKISFKFSQFKKLADDAKAGKKFKRIHAGQEDLPPPQKNNKNSKSTSGSSKVKAFKQFADETDKDYMRRVNRMTTESLREAEYEIKYGVKVLRDAKTGIISIKKQPKNEIDEMLKQKQKRPRSGRVGKKGQTPIATKLMDPKTAKELIKQAIKEDEEEKKKEQTAQIEYKHDEFKFGEIVHAPPTLSTLPRKAQKSETVPRPGKKNNLLLKTLFNGNDNTNSSTSTTTAKKTQKQKSTAVTKAQLKGKRRDLPAATRSMLENEQSKMIELYRQLKKSKEKSS